MKLKLRCIKSVLVFSSLIFVFFSGDGFIPTSKETLRVLFIGNSYTYYHSMPRLFKAMAEHKFSDRQVQVKFVGGGGATLKQHWEAGQALKEIKTGTWNYVVLQEQSMLGSAVIENGERYFGSPDQFFEYARMFDRANKQHGAKTVFYMTWSRKNHKDQQKYLTYAYMTIAKDLNSLVAPVGLVWDKVRKHTELNLYEKDGSHPSIYGSFTAATMLFAIIFDTKPIDIYGRLEGYKILRGGKLANKKSVLCDLSDTEVKVIQDSTAVVFEQMKGNDGYLKVEKAVSEKEPTLLSIIVNHLSTAKGQTIYLIIIAVIFLAVKGITKFFDKRVANDSQSR